MTSSETDAPVAAAGPTERERGDASPAPREDRPSALGCSVVVPVLERPESLDTIFRSYAPAVQEAVEQFEFIFVVPAAFRGVTAPLDDLDTSSASVRVVEVGEIRSEATLLKAGADHARNEVILTLPAYHRVKPEGLPKLIRALEPNVDLIMARREPRRDPWINQIQSRVFHGLLRGLTGARTKDTGCGVRVIRRDVLLDMPIYGDYHRFLSVIAHHEGYRVEEIGLPHHPADADTRLHDPGVYLRRLVDLLGVFFLLKFAYKPLRFFGLAGSLLTVGGGLFLLVLLVQRLNGQPLAGRPALVLAVLVFTLGLQFIGLGLTGEMIVHFNSSRRPAYRVRETEGEEDE